MVFPLLVRTKVKVLLSVVHVPVGAATGATTGAATGAETVEHVVQHAAFTSDFEQYLFFLLTSFEVFLVSQEHVPVEVLTKSRSKVKVLLSAVHGPVGAATGDATGATTGAATGVATGTATGVATGTATGVATGAFSATQSLGKLYVRESLTELPVMVPE